jgi:hypothetical protein
MKNSIYSRKTLCRYKKTGTELKRDLKNMEGKRETRTKTRLRNEPER